MIALISLAFGAGLLSPVNPCGFALLPAYLATFLSPAATDTPLSAAVRLRRAITTGTAVTAGFIATTTVVGIALAAGLRALVTVIPWIGAILVVAGGVLTGLVWKRTSHRAARPTSSTDDTGCACPAGQSTPSNSIRFRP
jgi:cytochrome c biogenesis protein CcdA